MGTVVKGNIRESMVVDHYQKMVKANNPKLPVISTPIHMGESHVFCDGIKASTQSLKQVFKQEQKLYETRHVNYLKYFGVHAGIKRFEYLEQKSI